MTDLEYKNLLEKELVIDIRNTALDCTISFFGIVIKEITGNRGYLIDSGVTLSGKTPLVHTFKKRIIDMLIVLYFNTTHTMKSVNIKIHTMTSFYTELHEKIIPIIRNHTIHEILDNNG